VDTEVACGASGVVGVTWGAVKVMRTTWCAAKVDEAGDDEAAMCLAV
jgi:hypothetical protein